MSTPAADLLAPQLALLEARFPERRIALPSGAQVAVRECGTRSSAKPSVVLLHGISSGAASWLHAAVLLGTTHHVVAWDAPGYGDSTPLAGAAPQDSDYAARLHELLQALGIARCVLVGHSLGALMAAAYARELGRERVAQLVLMSPAGGYGAPQQAEARQRVRKDRQEALRTQGIATMAERIPQRLLTAAADDAARAWVQWNTARLNAAGYLQAVELLCGSDLAASRGRLAMPVEVHVGDADVVTTPEVCRGLAEALGASFALIAQAGHACPVEQPEAVAQAIARAVRSAA